MARTLPSFWHHVEARQGASLNHYSNFWVASTILMPSLVPICITSTMS
jgi:hypothetical protein